MLTPVDPFALDVTKLLKESDAFMASLYPPESNYMLSAEALAKESVSLMGWYNDETLSGIAALVKAEDDEGEYAEIKRFIVDTTTRGQGIGRKILAAMVDLAKKEKLPRVCLETGTLQPNMIHLAKSLDFVERAPYGNYPDDPWSVFMERTL